MKKWVLALLAGCLLCTPSAQAREQESPAFWQRQTAHSTDILLDTQALQSYQRQLVDGEPHTLVDLASLHWSYSAATLRQWIDEPAWPEDVRFCNGQPYNSGAEKAYLLPSDSFWQTEQRPFVQYGILTANTNLRTFPTSDVYTTKPDGFDQLQETSLDLGEPIAILLEHPSRPWLYVQNYHYRGWIKSDTVARVPTRKNWLVWVQPAEHRMALQPQSNLSNGANLRMGASLPVENGKVLLPQRDNRGQLTTLPLAMLKSDSFTSAPLPYTRQAIIQQALLYYNTPYGWGDSGDGVDCSGFVVRVFRSIGLSLPRNADEQEAAPGWKRSLSGKTTAERRQILDALPPGSLLHMDGHVMIYLGKSDGDYWIIHAYTGHLETTAAGPVYRKIMRVAISPLTLQRSNGATFLDSLTSVRQWLPDDYSS